jgi:hypothetical protein
MTTKAHHQSITTKDATVIKHLVDFAQSHHAKEEPAAGRLRAVGAQSSGSILCEIDTYVYIESTGSSGAAWAQPVFILTHHEVG